ncbi:helix-turn-helix transcriptional regulator [Halobacterium jilantaiense]|uniref:IclR helix-turn-helix domain-containing protein n=1 Tax=Halobacterium jilantaiense TaxID=355548 RepID=A0A1I0PZG5_9EURY|nr:hypothetical protein [Halobacterium jilantaiense]SEW20011.1 hypothetical protein SAMN04487945_2125 [Halobacterium jilantaiense]
MRQAALLVALACLVVAPLAGAGAVGQAVAPSAGAPATPATVADSPEPQLQDRALEEEGVHFAVQLEEDGDARWNVSATYHLETENDTAAFDRLAAAFKAGETDGDFSVDVFRAAAPEVSDRVDRSMEVTDARRTATTVDHGNNSTGVLSLQFTWTDFAAVNNETLAVDGFSGGWFGDLRDGQTLSIRQPDGYGTENVSPETNVVGGAYQWEGPKTFERGQPSLVFTTGPTIGGDDFPVVAVGGLLAVVGVVVVWRYLRRDGEPASDGEPDSKVPNPERETEREPKPSTDPVDESAASTSGGSAAGADADGSDTESAAGGVDPELLSDEERVERLLAENGGRMKQSKIVEETRWSTAKVSQLLSSMDEADRVEKLRIGRENLISLPGEGFEDE